MDKLELFTIRIKSNFNKNINDMLTHGETFREDKGCGGKRKEWAEVGDPDYGNWTRY